MTSAPCFDRVLVIVFPARGDVLLATGLIRGIKRQHPEAQIDVLTQTGQGDVLIGNGDVRNVIETKRGASHREGYAYVRSIWNKYDITISTSASDRAALYTYFGSRYRVSILPHESINRWKRWLHHEYVTLDAETHTLAEIAALGEKIGLEHCLEVVPPRDAKADARLDEVLPGWRERPFAVLHPTPREAYKRWHKEGWRELAAALEAEGLDLVVTGSNAPAERAYLDELLSVLPPSTRDVAGALSLGQMTALLEHSRLYVGVDTLVGHLAASVNAPSVVVFGPTKPSKWAPWPYGRTSREQPHARVGSARAGNVFIVQGTADCVPCDRLGCLGRPDSHSDCLDQLGAHRVLSACREMLRWSAARFGDACASPAACGATQDAAEG